MKFHDSLSLNHLNQTACNMTQKLILVPLSLSPSLGSILCGAYFACENDKFGSDSLAALSPSFWYGFSHSLHYFWNDDYLRH